MPINNHVVIILDVNSIPRKTTVKESVNNADADVKHDPNSVEMDSFNSSTQSVEAEVPEDHPPDAIEELYPGEWLKSLTEMVLILLCQEALNTQGKFNFSRVMWSFKIFNSSIELNSITGKKFLPFDIQSFEAFEKQLESHLNLSSSPDNPNKTSNKSRYEVNRIEFLSTAIKSVVSDLNWPEPMLDEEVIGKGPGSKNAIHAFLRVPRNEQELYDFFPNAPSPATQDLMMALVPRGFAKKMRAHGIQLNLVDLWKTQSNQLIKTEVEWDGVTYARTINRVLHYLNSGKVIPFNTKIGEGIPYGFPSYISLLKIALSSSQLEELIENTPVNGSLSTIQKLSSIAPSKSNRMASKVSPVDSDSAKSNTKSFRGESNLQIARIPNGKQTLPTARKDDWSYVVRKGSSRNALDMHPVARKSLSDLHRTELSEMVKLSRKRKHEEEARKVAKQRGYSQMEMGMRNSTFWDEEIDDDEDQRSEFRLNEHEEDYEQETVPRSMRRYNDLAIEPRRRSHGGRSGAEKTTSAAYTPSPSPRAQPSKRIRQEERTSIERAKSLKQSRHSDPLTTGINRSSQSTVRTGSSGSRGRAMLVECQKRDFPRPRLNPKLIPAQHAETDKERTQILMKKRSKSLKVMKTRLDMLLNQSRSHDSSNPVEYLACKIGIFKDMIVVEENRCLLSSAQAMVSVLAGKLMELQVVDIRSTLEEILIVAFDKLNLMILQKKNSEEEDAAFRECQLQILLRFEIPFIAPLEDRMQNKENKYLQEEVIRILNLITAYRKKPPIEDFINDVLVVEYHQLHGRLLLEVSYAVNITVSPLLNKYDDNDSNGEFSDQDSIASSAHSSMCLGDSVSQIGHNSPHTKGMPLMPAAQHSGFLYMHNDKRKIMIPAKIHSQPASRPKNDLNLRIACRSATARASPKRVRRNLFDVHEAKDPKELKYLLSLATTSSFARSPSLFKSPSSKKSYSPISPGRPSPFFRAARSRRRLVLDPENDDQWEPLQRSAGVIRDDLMCPESPATPTRKRGTLVPGSSQGSGSVGGKSVVQESPEVEKSGYSSRPISERVNSISFYSSTGTESQKSRAWAKSGAKLMAARIRDSVDVGSSLTLNDLEFLPDSPDPKDMNVHTVSGDGNPIPQSPVACSSKSMPNSHFQVLQSGDDSINFNIEALMTSEILPTSSDIFNMNTSNSSSLNTPSKKVQFNLRENLVNTPSPARFPIQGTPKSILKDGGSSEFP